MILVADMIELGQIRAGVVVGTEDGRPLVESTIDSLLANPALTRQEMKADFASLTIGSGSAAIVLCDRKLSRRGHRLLGGGFRADTTSHELCTGGDAARASGDALRMQTDSESLLHAGIDLAADTWCDTKRVAGLVERGRSQGLYASDRPSPPQALVSNGSVSIRRLTSRRSNFSATRARPPSPPLFR